MSDVLVQYLREARATEAGLTQTLQAHIAATPPSEHHERLEQHLETTRAHEQMLAARLRELDHGGDPLEQALELVSGPVGYTLGVARGAARLMLSVLGLPLTLVRGTEPSTADRVLRNVRAESASSALEVATYTAIERLAKAEGDEKTARLAGQLRRDEEEMLAYLRDAVVELSDRLAGTWSEVGGQRSEGTTPEATRPEARGQRPEGGNGSAPVVEPPPPPPAPEPQPAEPAPPPHVSEEPELVAEFGEAGAEEEAGAEVEIAEPWEGYDRMNATEIGERLEDASDELAAMVRLYETAGKNRQSVLKAAERRLRLG